MSGLHSMISPIDNLYCSVEVGKGRTGGGVFQPADGACKWKHRAVLCASLRLRGFTEYGEERES